MGKHFHLKKGLRDIVNMLLRSPPPGCVWAQRPKHVILTICLTDCKDPVINVEKKKLYFKGVGGTERRSTRSPWSSSKRSTRRSQSLLSDLVKCRLCWRRQRRARTGTAYWRAS